MNESAEVNYREIQYGQRLPDGRINILRCGPRQAAMYRGAGHDILQRERTVYRDDLSQWHAAYLPDHIVTETANAPAEDNHPTTDTQQGERA